MPPPGQYANYLQIGYNALEFVLDFGQQFEGAPEPGLHTRIVTTPVYARGFLRLLRETLEEHERKYADTKPGEGS